MDGSYVTKNFISNSVASVFLKVSPIWMIQKSNKLTPWLLIKISTPKNDPLKTSTIKFWKLCQIHHHYLKGQARGCGREKYSKGWSWNLTTQMVSPTDEPMGDSGMAWMKPWVEVFFIQKIPWWWDTVFEVFTFGLCYQCGYHDDLRIDRPFRPQRTMGSQVSSVHEAFCRP